MNYRTADKASSSQIVVIGASSGGLDAVQTVAGGLSHDFPAPICVVIHTSPDSPGVIHEIVGRATDMVTVALRQAEKLEAGKIYFPPPDCHLVIEPGRVRATKGPKENRFRPAIDPLFRTAAQVFGPRAIGVILTGNLDDGTAGLGAIKRLGGRAIVQDPRDALFPAMPQSAIGHVNVDYCVRLDQIAPLLIDLTGRPVRAPTLPIPRELETEVRIDRQENPKDAGLEHIAKPSPFSCPDCHGVLLQIDDENRVRFRCHVGHGYSIDSLLAAYSEQIEGSLWTAIRSLEETALFLDELTRHAKVASTVGDADRFASRAAEARKHSAALRDIVSSRGALVAATSDQNSPKSRI
jgi:two-component system, chemotaxis family, protein-glutamate methylesterase/glutaminase